MVGREVFFYQLRRQRDVARTNRLVRILRAGLGFEGAGLVGVIFLTVAAENKALGRFQRVLGQAQRIGSHIGDKADCAFAGDVHAFIKLLCNGHRAPRRHAQTAGGLLLKGRSDKWGRGAALLFTALDAFDVKRVAGNFFNDLVNFLAAGKLNFLRFRAVETGDNAARFFGSPERDVKVPVFLGCKVAYLNFTLDNHSRCNGLNASGGKPSAHLAPEQRTELIAHDAVKDAAGLLGIDQINVDIARGSDALRDDFFSNFVKGDASGLFVRQAEKLLEMPRNSLPLAVGVGCKINNVSRL